MTTTKRYIPDGYIKAVENLEFNIQVFVNVPKLTALGFYGKAVKPAFHYRYRTPESLKESVSTWYKNLKTNLKEKSDRKALIKKANSELDLEKHFKIGTILYSCWGYDQTNIDWYQVKEIKGKKLLLQRIQSKIVETSFMSGNSEPVKDSFIETEFYSLVHVNYIQSDGTPRFGFSKFADYECISTWDGKSKSCSWYA